MMNTPPQLEDFLYEIKTELELRGISRTAFAQRMGTTPEYVSRILKGKTNITFGTANKMACAVGAEFEARII